MTWLLPYSTHEHADRAPTAPAIAAQNLSMRYPGSERLALDGLHLTVPSGARVALVGPNGSGKLTLLKGIAGLLPGCAGEITIYGHPRGGCHHRVAYLPQRGDVDWRFPISVWKLVLTGRYVHLGWLRRPRQHDRAIAAERIAWLGLEHLAGRQIGQLSGGHSEIQSGIVALIVLHSDGTEVLLGMAGTGQLSSRYWQNSLVSTMKGRCWLMCGSHSSSWRAQWAPPGRRLRGS